MFESCNKKQEEIKKLFAGYKDQEDKYKALIELGRQQASLEPKYKIPENIVQGCQSLVYLRAYLRNGTVFFEVESNALISAGLAMLLFKVYNGETPEVILTCPPTYLDVIGVGASLTPSRSNGLYSIHLRMKQEALKLLLEREKQSKESPPNDASHLK